PVTFHVRRIGAGNQVDDEILIRSVEVRELLKEEAIERAVRIALRTSAGVRPARDIWIDPELSHCFLQILVRLNTGRHDRRQRPRFCDSLYALPSLMLNDTIVTDWPSAMLVFCSSISPPPPLIVTVPWMWHVVSPES